MLKNINLTIVLAGVIFLSSCKSSYITVNVLEPAQIDVPNEIKSLVIVNRSLPAKDKRAGNIIEGVLSGEGLFNDRMGSEQCVIGAADLINNSPRFKAVLGGDMDIRGTGTGAFPEPLEWDFTRQTCDRYNVDAMVTLATFDSDSHIDYSRHEYTREEDGKKIRVVEFDAVLNMTISAGWRIYYPDGQAIIDENVYVDNKSFGGSGSTKNQAKNNLPSKQDIIQEAGFYAGQRYAARISPVWINVSRNYFSKGHPRLEGAARYAKQGDWNRAAEIWETILDDPDKKIAGQAAYNLALASEMTGDLQEALKWAEKSYYDFGIKRARNYINIIKGRISDEKRLDKQLQD